MKKALWFVLLATAATSAAAEPPKEAACAARVAQTATSAGAPQPGAIINTSRSNVKGQRVGLGTASSSEKEDGKSAATADGAEKRQGSGTTGTCAHAINTKGTGVAGRTAVPAKECVGTSASQNGQTLRQGPSIPPQEAGAGKYTAPINIATTYREVRCSPEPR